MVAQNREASPAARLLLAGLKGFLISVLAAAAMLFIFAGIAYSAEDPDSVIPLLGYVALFVSAAAGGGIAGRLSGEYGGTAAIAGAASGVFLLGTVILMSLLPAEAAAEPLSPLVTALMYGAVPAVAALMGFILRMRKKVRHHRRRR